MKCAVPRGMSVAWFAAIVFASGCHRTVLSSSEMASRVVVSPCPAGASTATPASVPPLATLTVIVRTDPVPPAGAEATLRLDGETTRSSLRIDPALPQPFSLARGVYLVRVSLPGYVGVEGRAALSAGCEATMTMVLKQRI